MAAASFFTYSAIAATTPTVSAPSEKVHLLNNLKESDLRLVMKVMQERGYQVVGSDIFSQSSKTVTITQALADEVDPASIEIQVLEMNKKDALPQTVFNHKVITDDLTKALESLPRPSDLPVLGQNH